MELQDARLKLVGDKGNFDFNEYITQLFGDNEKIENLYHETGAISIFERLGFKSFTGAEDCYNNSLCKFVGDDADVLD